MTTSIKYTREQYLNNECSHHDYYKQFVTKGIIDYVKRAIGKDKILNSKDEHFNDIPLRLWDNLYIPIPNSLDKSLATKVCLAKCAAVIIKEGE